MSEKNSVDPVEVPKGAYSRRRFLQSMVLGSAGALVALHTTKASPSWVKTSAQVRPKTVSPKATFLSGEVISKSPSSLQVRNENSGVEWTVDFAKNLSVWKGTNTSSANVIEIGDQVSLKGRVSGPNAIAATRIWDNLAWRKGRIAAMNSASLIVVNGSERATVVFSGDTEWFSAGSVFDNYSGKLHTGNFVRALGLLKNTGELVAIRVWAAA